jgi:hypothetical protein
MSVVGGKMPTTGCEKTSSRAVWYRAEKSVPKSVWLKNCA